MESVVQNIRDWLTDALQEGGMWPTEGQLQEAMLADMEPRLMEFVTGELLKSLPAEKLNEFVDWQKKDFTKEDLLNFFQKNLADMDGAVNRALQSFRAVLLNQYATV